MPVGQNEWSHFLPFAQRVAEHTSAASAGGQMLLAPRNEKVDLPMNVCMLCTGIIWICYVCGLYGYCTACLNMCIYIYVLLNVYIYIYIVYATSK